LPAVAEGWLQLQNPRTNGFSFFKLAKFRERCSQRHMTNTKARGRLNSFARGIYRILEAALLETREGYRTEGRSPVQIKRAETQTALGPFYCPFSLALQKSL
jgi:hypothetical protein